MSTLPNVSANETADLRDVHARLAKSALFSYWRALINNDLHRVCVWAHSFWPRLF